MAKIKLSESQVKMIEEYEKSLGKKKILKITKEHYDSLFGINENHPAEGSYIPQSEEGNGKTTDSFNENISEDINTILDSTQFIGDFLNAMKEFLNNPSQEGLSPFWVKNGVTWGDLISLMTSFGIVLVTAAGVEEGITIVKDRNAIKKGVKFLGRHLWNIFSKKKRYDMSNKGSVIQDEGLTERDGDYPAGAEHDPSAPWNQNDDYEEEPEVEYRTASKIIFEPIFFEGLAQDDITIFKHNEKLFVYGGGYRNGEELEEYCNTNQDISVDCISNFVNDTYAHGKFKVGTYTDDYLRNNVLTVVDNNVKNDLLKYYGDSEKLSQILGGIEETTTTGSVGGSYVTPKIWAKSPSDMKFGKSPIYKGGKILKKPISEIDKVKMERFVAEIDMYIFAEDKEHAIVEANNIAKLVNKKFDANARVTKIVPRGFGQLGENFQGPTTDIDGITSSLVRMYGNDPITDDKQIQQLINKTFNGHNADNKTKRDFYLMFSDKIKTLNRPELNTYAQMYNYIGRRCVNETLERKGQVEFDDCTKLNNNTEAQEGGCSVGAVDNVVKVDESIIKEVAKKTGRSISEVKEIILKHKTINNGK